MILDVAGSIPVGRPNRSFARATRVPLRDLTPADFAILAPKGANEVTARVIGVSTESSSVSSALPVEGVPSGYRRALRMIV